MNRKDFLKAGLVMIGGVWVPKQQGATIIVRGPVVAAAAGPSPIGWWKLNEGSGTSAADDSGNSNTGTLTSGPTWTTGPNSNGAVSFDGSDDYISVANESNFDFDRTDAFSLCAWVKINSGQSGNKAFFSKLAPSGNNHGYQFFVNADNLFAKCFFIQTDGNAISCETSSFSLAADTWYHLALTYAGGSAGSGITIYINGSSSATGSGTLSGSMLNDANLSIGGFPAWPGAIDDARVYDVELSSGQVSTIYNAGAQ